MSEDNTIYIKDKTTELQICTGPLTLVFNERGFRYLVDGVEKWRFKVKKRHLWRRKK